MARYFARTRYTLDGTAYAVGDEIPADVYGRHRPVLVRTEDGDTSEARASEAGASEADALPALSGMNKAELIAQAEDEGVDLSDATNNTARREAIEAARSA